MALKKELFNEKGYSKHKNQGMSILANSLVSLADGEIDKITLANGENKIKLTITEKDTDSQLLDMERETFRNSLKGNTGMLPYYISEYFGNKEVPRYLTKGEAAYVMTIDPELQLLGVKSGKGGSTIISKDPISLENNGDYNKYKTFMTLKAADTPAIDKALTPFENFEGKNYEDTLISESKKIYEAMMAELEKEKKDEYNELLKWRNCENGECSGDEEITSDLAEEYFDGSYHDEEDDIDDADKAADTIASELDSSDSTEDKDYDSEVMEDITEVSKDNLIDEDEESENYEEEILNSLDNEEDIEE